METCSRSLVLRIDGSHLNTLRLGVCPDHLDITGRDGVHDVDDVAPGDAARHEGRLGHRRRSVVHARVGYLHPHELANEALKLVHPLQVPLAQLGLVGRIRRGELAPEGQVPHDAGNEVVVGAAAQEEGMVGRVDVLVAQLLELALELQLADQLGQQGAERPLGMFRQCFMRRAKPVVRVGQ